MKIHEKPIQTYDIDQSVCTWCQKQFSDKYKCKRHIEQNCKIAIKTQNVCPLVPNVNISVPKINPDVPKINPTEPNINIEEQNVNPLIKCSKCYKSFSCQSTLNRHVRSKRCQGIQHPFECCKCHKVLSSAQSKSKHQKSCNKAITNTLSVQPPILQQINNTTNTNCNINNYTQNIYVNNIGAENMMHISEEFIRRCLLNLHRGVCNYIEKVNFNPDVPENHNIRYEDTRNVKVKEGDNVWRLRNIGPALQDLIKTRCRELEAHYEANEEIKFMDKDIPFYIIRNHLQYLMNGVRKEVKPVIDHITTLLKELEMSYTKC